MSHDDEVRGAATAARANPSPRGGQTGPPPDESAPRAALLDRRISELGLSIEGSPVERLVERLYQELDARGLSFKPPVYLSDQWGCPDGTPLITQEQRLRQQALTTKPPDPDRVFAWKRAMDAGEVRRFGRVAGKLLTELGYEA